MMAMMNKWIGFIFMLGVLVSKEASAMSRSENDSQMKPLVVVLLGPPGAGKGTHAGPLSKGLGIPHVSTGDLFRENIRAQTPLGNQAKSYIDKGHLVPDELVLDMLFSRVERSDCKEGYILDGFPRTLAQAKALDQRLKLKAHVVVLNFYLPDAVIIERITGRVVCKDCAKPYHKKFDPPKNESVCDICSGQLIQRGDDNEEIVRKRLEVYRAQTEPLIQYYAKQKDVLREIDSEKEKAQVFRDVLEAIPIHTQTAALSY